MATGPENIAKVRQVLNQLIQAGDPEKPMFYAELERLTGVHRHTEALTVLGDLSRDFFAEHGLLISSLVVAKETGFPGAGYFKLAQELGVFPEGESTGEYIDRTFFPSEKAGMFWRSQRDAIFQMKPTL